MSMKKPTLKERFRIAGSLLWGSPWEGANQSPNRSRLNVGAPTDFKYELTEYSHSELVKNMRYLRKNSGFIREYINTLALYSAPVRPQSLVENHDWRKQAEELYEDRRRVADVTERFTGNQIQGLISKAVDTDGEIFVIKTRDSITGLPRLQLIESHRVGDFGRGGTHGGMKTDSKGRVTAIRVRQDNDSTRMIPMRHVMHIFDPDSPSALRHPPTLAHSINHRLDVEELLALEKKGVKDNAEISRIIRLSEGSDIDDEELGELLGGTQSAEAERTNPMAMQRILGGKAFALQDGEDIESFHSNRPNPTFTGFLDHLDKESSRGGVPHEFCNPAGLNAGAVRLVTERMKRIASRRSDVILERFLRPDWFFVIGTAIDEGELEAVKGWHRISGGLPAQATVDAGRNDESLRRNIEMGIVSPSEAAAERGKSFSDVIETTAKDMKTVAEIAEREGIDPDSLFRFVKAEKGDGGTSGGAGGGAPSAKKPDSKPSDSANGEVDQNIIDNLPDFESLKSKFDAYGVAVRSGVITPQKSDEEQFRREAGLPPMSPDANREWNDTKGVKRPVTLTPKEGKKAGNVPAPVVEE